MCIGMERRSVCLATKILWLDERKKSSERTMKSPSVDEMCLELIRNRLPTYQSLEWLVMNSRKKLISCLLPADDVLLQIILGRNWKCGTFRLTHAQCYSCHLVSGWKLFNNLSQFPSPTHIPMHVQWTFPFIPNGMEVLHFKGQHVRLLLKLFRNVQVI